MRQGKQVSLMEDSGLKGEQVAEHIGERSETSSRSWEGKDTPLMDRGPTLYLLPLKGLW